MKKKGFTLIELLAVIVILAIIAIIVTPVVTGIISQTKLSADMRSAEGYVKAAEDFYADAQINDDKKYYLDKNIISQVPVSNVANSQGYLSVNDKGKVTMVTIINNKCYIKKADQDLSQIEVIDGNIDDCTSSLLVTPDTSCFTYTKVDASNITITDYTCDDKNIVIPDKIEGVPVTSLGSKAFYNKHLISIKMPNTIKTIGSLAFYNDYLVSANIPTSIIDIGSGAFRTNYLTNITLPEGLKTIQATAFYGNRLTELTIPSTVTSIGVNSFGSNSLKNLTIPSNITVLSNYVFYDNLLENVTLSEGLTEIQENTFCGNNLKEVKFPSTLTKIIYLLRK